MNKVVSVETTEKKVNSIVEGFRSGEYKIPRYQRGYVWDGEMTTKLLLSILKGFPMGSILTWQHKENDKNISYLIDGQQRTQTIMNIIMNPMEFQNKETLSMIYKENISSGLCKELKDKLKDKTSEDLKLDGDLMDNEKRESVLYALASKAYSENYSSHTDKQNDDFSLTFTSRFSSFLRYITGDRLVLPVTEIKTNDEKNIIEIFNIINTTGKELTKFEILASQWSLHKIKLNKVHQEKVEKLYKDNHIDDKNTRDEINTPAELMFSIISLSLSESDKIIKLFEKTNCSKEFDYSHMDKMLWIFKIWIHNHFEKDTSLEDFDFGEDFELSMGEKIKEIYDEDPNKIDEFVESLKDIWRLMELRIKILDVINNTPAIKSTISRNMFISVASQLLYEKLNWSERTKYQPREDIQLFLVKEILEKGFSKATTNKMMEDIKSMRYLKEDISTDSISTVIKNLNLSQKKETNFNDGFESTVKFIVSLAFKEYSDGSGVTFDYDHIFPKSVMKDKSIYENINTIGNCGYLESRINRSEKRNKIDKEECLSDRLLKMSEVEITKDDYSEIIDKFLAKGKESSSELFKFMDKRYAIIIKKFLKEINPIKHG